MRTQFKTTNIPDTAETSIVPAGGAGVKSNLLKLNMINGGPTDATVDIRDNVGGVVIFSYLVKAGTSAGFSGNDATIQTTANSQWTAKSNVATALVVSTVWINA